MSARFFRLDPRRLEDEQLDHLPPDDPRAIASRGDLQRLNRLLGTTGGLARALRRLPQSDRPRRIVELGAGDCRSSLRLLMLLGPSWRGSEFIAVDRADAAEQGTRAAMADAGWRCAFEVADVFEWLDAGNLRPGDAVIASLFLHHFDEAGVRRLFAASAQTGAAFFCAEPRRWKPALWGSRCFRWLGFSPVTCNDAVVSVRAGFAEGELTSLWPSGGGWNVSEGHSVRGVVHFSALPRNGTRRG